MLAQSHAKLISPVGSEVLVLQSMRAQEALSTPYEIAITAIAETAEIDEAQILGQDCAVEIMTNFGKLAWFAGQAASFRYLGIHDGHHLFELHLRPTLWFLEYNTRFTIFQNKSVIEILEKVLSRAGVSRVRFEQTAAYEPIEYVVQYGESDLNFVQRLIEHHGLFYYFDHAADGETLVIIDDRASLKPGDPESLPFATRGEGGGGSQREEVDGWQQTTRVMPHAYAARDYQFKQPLDPLQTEEQTGPQRSDNVQERYLYPGGYDKQGEGVRLAKLRTEYMEGARERFVGTLDAIGCRVGRTLQLTEHPHAPYNQKYIVLGSRWIVSTTSMRSAGGSDWSLKGTIEFQRAELPHRARFTRTKPRAMGPHTARVVGPPGEEIWSDEYGRVKVSFQWDRESPEDDRSSCWLRVMTPWAGPDRGFFVLPRIGDEVLVWFLDGDPDRPFVAGSVFNGDNASPTGQNPAHFALRSRSTKHGGADNFNEVRFEDELGAERVYAQAERDMRFLVKRNRDGEIDGSDTLHVGGKRSVTIEKNDTLKVNRSRNATIRDNDSLTVGRSADVNIGIDATVSVGENLEITSDENTSVDVGRSLKIVAGDEVEISVGAASLVMKKDGTIRISGMNVTVDANSTLKLSGCTLEANGLVNAKLEAGVKLKLHGTLLDATATGITKVSGALVRIG